MKLGGEIRCACEAFFYKEVGSHLSNPDVVSRNARNRNVGPETAQVNYWNIGIRHIVNNVIAGVEIRNYAVAAPAVIAPIEINIENGMA